MLGSSKIVNLDQVQDCLDRGWVVIAPNHRLCPQVDLFEGPMQDCRDLLSWIYDGELEQAILNVGGRSVELDLDHVFAFGTSSGGTLAMVLVCMHISVARVFLTISGLWSPSTSGGHLRHVWCL